MSAPVLAIKAAVHSLVGRSLPRLMLEATDGTMIDMAGLSGPTVIYTYPRTSPPNGAPIIGWADIPGAKGCTPQSCGFRDHHAELIAAGAMQVFGISTQSSEYQKEVAERLHLPFSLLSNEALKFQQSLNLPVFEAGGTTLLHRLTLIAVDDKIEKVFGPISDPAANANDVLNYFKAR